MLVFLIHLYDKKYQYNNILVTLLYKHLIIYKSVEYFQIF